jgi:hypothetical protein
MSSSVITSTVIGGAMLPHVPHRVAGGRRLSEHGSSSTTCNPDKYEMGIGAHPLGQRCR